MENPKSFLPPGKIAAFIMDKKWRRTQSSQIGFLVGQDFLEELSNYSSMDRYLRLRDTIFMQCEYLQNSLMNMVSVSTNFSLQALDFLLLEVVNWFTRWNLSTSSANTVQSCLTTMLSLILNILQITLTPTKLEYSAVLNCKMINGTYTNLWDIRQLFDYWRSRHDDQDLSDTETQTKLASLSLSICFIRINETAEINLIISNIDQRNQTAIFCLSPKANNSIEQYKIRRTGDPKVCPNSTLFASTNRLYWHYGMDSEQIANFFWQLDGQPADKRQISLQLNSLLREIGIHGATVYLFKHVASTEQARCRLETTKLNFFTHHSVFSRATSN
ncbi:MAG: hypothetical protein EZS28_021699 [Streblomastix strix]|uniref:Uncharacterized protein n=1 Tax=Streblomastix strix TaxID=222440 RepID=A0A5J4VJT6_9EUKA|nr:MAG: hypothetical protein EZS28_021699 [Streblomastix strix]